MVEYKILNIIGKNCVTIDDGTLLYLILLNHLKKEEKIILNFDNVNIFTCAFFNYSIGRLVKDFTQEELYRLIDFINLNNLGKNILILVIKNAQRFYFKKGELNGN